MIDELGGYLKREDEKEVGILSTYGAYLGGIRHLKKYGITPVFPDENVRKMVHDAIYHPEFGIRAVPQGTGYSPH